MIQDFLGKSDPYLEFKKQNPDGSFSVVHRTQVSCHPIENESRASLYRFHSEILASMWVPNPFKRSLDAILVHVDCINKCNLIMLDGCSFVVQSYCMYLSEMSLSM